MARFFLVLIMTTAILSGCSKDAIKDASVLYGTWVKEGGGLPADTLRFFSKGNKNMLAFEFSTTGGINWPAHVETEYRFSNNKLEVKAVPGGADDFFPADSFEWITKNREFSVKLYQVVQYISADYRVTYRKLD
jgi:hypothetical protein